MNLWSSSDTEAATLGKASQKFAVNGLSIDTRTLKEGDLFVALQGDNRDGHDFVAAAFAARAGAALVSRKPEGTAGPLLTGGAHPARTGRSGARGASPQQRQDTCHHRSAGKTTTKEILARACNALGPHPCSAASYNNHWGVPLSLASLPQDAQFGIFEVGMNHFGEIRNLVSFVRPHGALITTIAPAHLEFFAIANHRRRKSEIFEGLEPGGFALIPADNPYAERLRERARQTQVAQIVGFGSAGEAKLLSFTPTAMACGSRPTYWAARSIAWSAHPACTSRRMWSAHWRLSR